MMPLVFPKASEPPATKQHQSITDPHPFLQWTIGCSSLYTVPFCHQTFWWCMIKKFDFYLTTTYYASHNCNDTWWSSDTAFYYDTTLRLFQERKSSFLQHVQTVCCCCLKVVFDTWQLQELNKLYNFKLWFLGFFFSLLHNPPHCVGGQCAHESNLLAHFQQFQTWEHFSYGCNCP